MLQPKRSKHRKAQKGRIRQVAKRGATIAFGSFALKALEPIWLSN
ncbi:MAG: ribosomal protein L16, partial [Flavitalea sp.]